MTLYEEILGACLESEEMREYLIQSKLDAWQLQELICSAVIPLEKKAELLRRMAVTTAEGSPVSHDPAHTFAGLAEMAEDGLAQLRLAPGELFLLVEMGYDDDFQDDQYYGAVPMLSLEAAKRYIREDWCMGDPAEYNPDHTCWYRLEKWIPDGDGGLRETFDYYLIEDQVIWFTPDDGGTCKQTWMRGNLSFGHSCADLNLPIPFRPGDLVWIDERPFRHPMPVCLLEVDNSDCCGVQALYRTPHGLWRTGAVKHNSLWGVGFHRPMMSPLLRLTSVQEGVPPDYGLLRQVKAWVHGDGVRGRQLWDRIHDVRSPDEGAISTDHLITILEEEWKHG